MYLDAREFLDPSVVEIFAVIIGFVLKHAILLSYHKSGHNFSIIHVTYAATMLAKLAVKKNPECSDCNCFGKFCLGIFLQLCCLLGCQSFSNYGFFGWIGRSLCEKYNWNYHPFVLKSIEDFYAIAAIVMEFEETRPNRIF